jgi:TPR repeat protein
MTTIFWMKEYLDGKYYDLDKLSKNDDTAKELIDICEDLTNDKFDLLRGMMYHEGFGYDKSIPDAIEYFVKASYYGNDKILYKIGTIYENDLKYHDLDKAIKWYDRAANNGNTDAMMKLGKIFSGQYGKEHENLDKAIGWYIEASVHFERVDGMIALGNLFMERHDVTNAIKWFEVSIEYGNKDAKLLIGDAYYWTDEREAIKWFSDAAENDYNIDAMIKLGNLYTERGQNETAIQWYRMAMENGDGTIPQGLFENIRAAGSSAISVCNSIIQKKNNIIKEQQKRIEKQQKRIEKLENKIKYSPYGTGYEEAKSDFYKQIDVV